MNCLPLVLVVDEPSVDRGGEIRTCARFWNELARESLNGAGQCPECLECPHSWSCDVFQSIESPLEIFMKATILIFVLTVLVAVSGVWWVNSRSPTEEELLVQEQAPASVVVEADSIESRQREWQAAIESQRVESPGPSAARTRQMAADQAREDRGLKGCFSMGNRCRCIGSNNQPVQVSPETCRLVASEPQD